SPAKKVIEKLLGDRIGDYKLIVVSSAEPYTHGYYKDKITVVRGAGGLITAMEPIIKLNGGLWIAHGRGASDKEVVNEEDKIKMPPGRRQYTLKRLWITKRNLLGWYYGLCNEALWPLCHSVFERPIFRQGDWEAYTAVNQQYADAVLKEIDPDHKEKVVVWIHDYHLALVPQMLREKYPDIIVGHFWHVPWPVAEIFRIFPWDRQVLEGMLGNQLIGFSRHSHCRNFLTSVSKTLEAKVDFDNLTITYNDRVTYVRHFPISIDYQAISYASQKSKRFGKSHIKQIVTGRYEFLSFGVERIDYIKGVVERIKAIDRFLEKYPEYQERFVHINVLQPSRTILKRYEQLDQEIETLIETVNFKYATSNWQPIHVIKETQTPTELYSLYKSANLMMVTSLAESMNLVAKEYVTAGPADGALILSEQTGAADELQDALIVNPYDIEQLADTIKRALEMPKDERKQRMEKLQAAVSKNNVYQWASKFLNNLIDINSHLDLKSESGNNTPTS
ncbi:trehalose-6-phosphate synthase, partial [Candidatus Parcubacteria bacterium]|nr:trehalose-6-phosphate synthase [Candidatus Parcubacteria bacterium]